MKFLDFSLTRKVFVILTILLLLISMLVAVGTAYCRYLTVVSAENDVEVRSKAAITLFGGEEWTLESEAEGEVPVLSDRVYRLDFTLGNYTLSDADEITVEERDVSAIVRFFAPLSEPFAQLRLTVDGEEYVGIAETIDENVFIGKKYGEGIVYKFYDPEGAERVWSFPGGVKSEAVMTALLTDLEALDENENVPFELNVENVRVK